MHKQQIQLAMLPLLITLVAEACEVPSRLRKDVNFVGLSTRAYLEAHVLVQGVSYGGTASILQPIPGQVEVVQ